MQQSHDLPTELFGSSSRKRGVQIPGHREEGTDDVIRLELVGIDQRPQQLIRGRQDLAGIVPADGSSPADTMKASWRRHGT